MGMHFVLTNDDGIEALGLELLAELAAERGRVTVVAPEQEQSGVGHRVNTRTPLRHGAKGEGRFAVCGTPADCTRVALRGLELSPDWVLSGLNHGGNLGIDLWMSGTVAGAREAAVLGRRAIALSQILKAGVQFDLARIKHNVRRVLSLLLERSLPVGHFYNVNLPAEPEGDEPEIVFCDPDPSPHDVRYRREGETFHYEGAFLSRPRLAGHDVDVAFGGRIAVSELRLL